MAVTKIEKIIVKSGEMNHFELEKTSVNSLQLSTFKNKELVSKIIINNTDINDIIDFMEDFRTD